MKLLEILPGLVILLIFAVIVICSFVKSWRKMRYNEKLIYVKELAKEVKTPEDQMELWYELMKLQVLGNTAEVKKMINEHILKYKN